MTANCDHVEIQANLSAATELLMETAMRTAAMEASYKIVKRNFAEFFLCSMGAIICFMQSGFAFLECGAVRIRNATNILFKNAMDSFVGGLMYWACGYAFAYGSSANFFIGYSNFFAIGLDWSAFANLFFQYSFAATATTIVSGAVAERMEMGAYLITAAVLTGIVYPVISHWAWDSRGWLAVRGFQDFAGSGVVHMCGGACAFVGAVILGPRYMRFTKGMEDVFRGHSVPHVALGAFIIFFGFLAFNGASVGDITADGAGEMLALAMLITLMSGATSALTTLIIRRRYSVNLAVNGAIAGMVAACAGCNVYYTYVGCICGVLAALTYNAVSWFNKKIKVDDPLDAVAVHFGGGFIGIIVVPFFDKDKGLFFGPDKKLAARILIWNMIGVAAIIVWAGAFCLVLFTAMRFMKVLRVNRIYEQDGMDERKHKEPAYPDVINIYNMVNPEPNANLKSAFELGMASSEPAEIESPTLPPWKGDDPIGRKTNAWPPNEQPLHVAAEEPKTRRLFRPKDNVALRQAELEDHPYVPQAVRPSSRRGAGSRRYRTRLQSADYPNTHEYVPEFRAPRRANPHPRY